MARRSGYLSDELRELAKSELKKFKGKALIIRKLEAIAAACDYGITEVAKIYDITRKTLLSWVKNFQKSRLEGLKSPPNRHRKSILVDLDREFIRKMIEENSQFTIEKMRQKVFENSGKKVSYTTMLREVKKLGYSHITPRPQHYKQDKEKVEAFKKKLMKS
jgi:transposase